MQRVPSERLIEHALALLVQSEVAPPQAAHDAEARLTRWRGQSAKHDAAADEARRRWCALSDIAPQLRSHFEQSSSPAAAGPAVSRQRRKLLLSVVGTLGGSAVLGRGAWWYWQQPLWTAAYDTSVSKSLKVLLADGRPGSSEQSRLDLAPESAVKFTLYRQRCSVAMSRGEVRFDVAPDASRPFEVLTRGARIEVVGTAFTVRDRGGPVTVGVEHGHVRVQMHAPIGAPGAPGAAAPLDLRAGDMLEIGAAGAHVVRQVDTASLSAWRDGWLVFDNALLSEALKSINAYRARPIAAADPQVGTLRLTGRFRADDSAGLVAALPTILPVNTVLRPDGGVALSLR